MTLSPKYSALILNLLVAIAISLVINFSYLLLLIVESPGEPPRPEKEHVVERAETGLLRVSPDGHGYVIYPNGDSVYVRQNHLRRLGLAEGDRLVVDLTPNHEAKAHPVLLKVKERNGGEFDYSTLYNRPSETLQLLLQLFYYLVVSFVLVTILVFEGRSYTMHRFVVRCLWALGAVALLYCLAPVADWRTGRIVLNFMSERMFDYMLVLKCSFTLAVSVLYARIYVLISQRQVIVLENEQLKNENLTTRYNMLAGQLNPHFFFNSLNSLAMLVREKQDEKALTYIDQLSYTFRCILQNSQSTLMTLDEELKFADAYGYLYKIRYADKLFIDIDIDDRYRTWRLPALSLQPLIGNAVKHNTITRSRPLHISVRTEEGWLCVSNPKVPKLEPEPSTGIGLENLRNRWHLFAGLDIEIIDDGETFTVRLPLLQPERS